MCWWTEGSSSQDPKAAHYNCMSLDLSEDGETVEIGACNNHDNRVSAGCARVLRWNGNSWEQKGDATHGVDAGDKAGLRHGCRTSPKRKRTSQRSNE